MEKKTVNDAVNESIKRGWNMSKQISSGSLFSYPVYDRRIVYSKQDLYRLIKEGFLLDSNAGVLALNILLNL